jgi:DNA-binding LacI/PurR family transcriptional regulator
LLNFGFPLVKSNEHRINILTEMTQKSSSITIRDVAQKANVSVATVSRYINRNVRVSDEVSQRIEQAIVELEYVPHSTARQLAMQETKVIAFHSQTAGDARNKSDWPAAYEHSK